MKDNDHGSGISGFVQPSVGGFNGYGGIIRFLCPQKNCHPSHRAPQSEGNNIVEWMRATSTQ
jgi:hypothetical protein